MAAVVVVLYLAVAAIGVVLAVVSGDPSVLSVAASRTLHMWGEDGPAPLYAGICGLNAWALWQVLRGPGTSRTAQSPRDVVWLRRLLYVGIVGDLALWDLVGELSDVVEYVASQAVWIATVVLLVRVVSGVSVLFRALALVLGLTGALSSTLFLFSFSEGTGRTIELLGLAGLGWTVMILVAQRRDGRWSDATVDIGRVALVVALLSPLLASLLGLLQVGQLFDDQALVLGALGVFGTVWLARTAHELAGPAGTPAAGAGPGPTPGRVPRAAVVAALVLPLVVVGAEEESRFALPGAQEGVDRQRAEQALDEARARAENERETAAWEAEMNARCTDPWPGVRAGRQGTTAYLLFEGGGHHVFDDRDESEGPGGDIDRAVDDGFVDAAGSSAVVMTDGENAALCVTVKAFGATPPLRLRGWERVVEVGLVSRSGRLVVPHFSEGGDSGTIRPLPDLAVGGPGRYRMRIYARALGWDEDDPDAPVEEHLIVVYPGRSTEKVVHRARR
ncbi:hypothetical protein ACLQ2R_21830 [Streptosporangium sp. DT93]|uniref:hypothetical protein n=1 Tax=Streptosporangium sp. DT93 TaxID=3393428 RepID=UPI003CF6E9C1